MALPTIRTSRNLTIVGILGVVAAGITFVAIPLVDGDPATMPNWGAFGTAALAAITAIMAKGSSNTGGTIPDTAEAEKRVQQ